MSYAINRVVVIGSGTMGGGIAAQVANAGLPVYLLDIAPGELTPEEEKRGLKLDHPKVRNRIVAASLERLKKFPVFRSQLCEFCLIGHLYLNCCNEDILQSRARSSRLEYLQASSDLY